MKSKYLFPHRFKMIGLLIMIPTTILGLYVVFSNFAPEFLDFTIPSFLNDNMMFGEDTFVEFYENNLLNEILGAIMIISSLLVAFSKEADEDEFIANIRLESLVWATYVNYSVLLVTLFFFYDITYVYVMIFNMFTILLFFILRFNWILWKAKKEL